jgi:hypothetical protein
MATCSFGLSATSQQYFSLRTNQPPATSQSTFLSQQISTSHQPPAKRIGCQIDQKSSAPAVVMQQ